MILHSDTVLDENGLPVPGAQVYVYDINGVDALMTSDGTTGLFNPLTTDEFGGYAYYANTGYYTEDVWYGGRRRWREHNIAIGNPGADLNLRADLATNTNPVLGAGAVNFNGSLAYPSSSVGDALKTNPPGTGAVRRAIQVKSAERVHAGDYGAVGDNSTDNTTALTNLFKAGREVYFPAGGSYLTGPIALSGINGLKIRGPGRDTTKIIPSATGTALTLSNCQWFELSALTIEALGANQSVGNATALQLDTGSCNALLSDFIIRGFSLDGIRQVGTSGSHLSGNTLRDGYVLGCGRNQVYGNYNDDFTIDNVQTGNYLTNPHAAFGILLDTCGEGALINTKTWSNARGYKALNCTGFRHLGIRVELSDNENVWVEGGHDHLFDSACRIFAASQAANGTYDNFYAKNTTQLILVGQVTTWDSTFSKWSINVDTGCDDVTLKCHQLGGYDATNIKAPIRVDSSVVRIASDAVFRGNAGAVSAASTVYLSGAGGQSGEGPAAFQCHTQMAPLEIIAASLAAPGSGQTFTYTLRKNGVDTGLTVQISGTATTASVKMSTSPGITYDVGDYFSLKLVTSATAAVTDHRITLVFAEF